MGVLFVLSLGDLFPVPLYRILHSFPMLEQLRIPDRLALAWTPLLCAVGGVGAVSLFRRWGGRATVAVFLLLFTGWAVSAHQEPWTVDPGRPLVTGEPSWQEARRVPMAAPVFVAGRTDTNRAAVRTNRSCLGCWDATELAADDGRATGAYPLPVGVALADWRPGRVLLWVDHPGVISLPETARAGWRATGRSGPLPLQSAPDGSLRVVAWERGWVTVRFVPPGLWTGGFAGVLGVVLWIVVACLNRRGVSGLGVER
jgi:hypothetical protein